MGKWTEVVVDDFIPTIAGRPLYVHSTSDSEFWSSLLEKAYAKVHGCYENLAAGNTADALVDFSGGLSDEIDLNGPRAAAGDRRAARVAAASSFSARTSAASSLAGFTAAACGTRRRRR